MKPQSSIKVFLAGLICFLVGFASLPQAEACQTHRKKARSTASLQNKKVKKSAKKFKGKKVAKHKKGKKRIIAPARVRIIDTGKKVTPDNFPIPDMNKIEADTGYTVVEPSKVTTGSADLTSSASDDFQDFENE